jgi:hypothetical protein
VFKIREPWDDRRIKAVKIQSFSVPLSQQVKKLGQFKKAFQREQLSQTVLNFTIINSVYALCNIYTEQLI